MRIAKLTPSLLMSLALGLSACGKSPLLHHDTANAATRTPSHESKEPTELSQSPSTPAECPLAFPKAGLCVSLAWTRMPAGDDTGSFDLKVWKSQQSSKLGPYADPAATVAVKLWMPSMGHGSSPVKVARKAEGQFEATDVYFVMPGAWEIHVQLKNGANVVEEAVLPIQI